MVAVNLSKWDFSYEFMLYEAAALVAGIDPVDVYYSTGPAKDNPEIFDFHEHPKIKFVADRMKRDYLFAIELYQAKLIGKWRYPGSAPAQNTVFRRREMEDIPVNIGNIEDPPTPDMLKALQTWKIEDDAIYESAKFTRQEIARWLSATGLQSIYKFGVPETNAAPNESQTSLDEADRIWPWGHHDTAALGHLNAAAQRFWVNYDPSDASTAPTNATVSEWLRAERRVSRTMADSIASLLRPDGLPTGPRK